MVSTTITKKILSLSVSALIFSLPLLTTAQNPIPPGGGSGSNNGSSPDTGITYECKEIIDGKEVYGNCNFDDLIKATKRVTDFAAKFTLMFSVIVIAWAGFIYLKSGGSSSERDKANKMLLSVAKGIAFILAAWLIVTLITNSLLDKSVSDLVPLG